MDILNLTTQNGQQAVEFCARLIKQGEIIVAPTDTVYGIIADASNKKAVNEIYKIKQRDKSRFLPIFVKNMAMAKKIAKISRQNEKFLEEKWPGKLTAVLPRNKNYHKLYGVDADSLAVRIPAFPFLNSLLETLNMPLTATSANISNNPPLTRVDDVLQEFYNSQNKPDLAINAGDLEPSKPSTIVDLRQKNQIIIRN